MTAWTNKKGWARNVGETREEIKYGSLNPVTFPTVITLVLT
jgi:hypothetical protein